MMDEALEAEIRAHVSSQDGRLVVLAPEEASSVVEEIAGRFIRDAAMTWWWDSLAKPGTAVQYGELDGLEHIGAVREGQNTPRRYGR